MQDAATSRSPATANRDAVVHDGRVIQILQESFGCGAKWALACDSRQRQARRHYGEPRFCAEHPFQKSLFGGIIRCTARGVQRIESVQNLGKLHLCFALSDHIPVVIAGNFIWIELANGPRLSRIATRDLRVAKAGFRARSVGQMAGTVRLPKSGCFQWLLPVPQHSHRCGGSAGVTPASQFSARIAAPWRFTVGFAV